MVSLLSTIGKKYSEKYRFTNFGLVGFIVTGGRRGGPSSKAWRGSLEVNSFFSDWRVGGCPSRKFVEVLHACLYYYISFFFLEAGIINYPLSV